MKISIIAAMTQNQHVIGSRNRLPWHLPEDLKRFKQLTMGHPILMGRKTFQSLGKPLPGRRNIVISRNPHFKAPDAEVVGSLEAALALCKESHPAAKEVFIIGGSEIFKLGLEHAQRLYLTFIDQDFTGDALFPAFDEKKFRRVEVTHHHQQDTPKTPALDYSFVTLERL